jgi:hypothetical protein
MIPCSLYANTMSIVPSQFKSLEYQVAANFNGEPLIPRITQLFAVLRITLVSRSGFPIVAHHLRRSRRI